MPFLVHCPIRNGRTAAFGEVCIQLARSALMWSPWLLPPALWCVLPTHKYASLDDLQALMVKESETHSHHWQSDFNLVTLLGVWRSFSLQKSPRSLNKHNSQHTNKWLFWTKVGLVWQPKSDTFRPEKDIFWHRCWPKGFLTRSCSRKTVSNRPTKWAQGVQAEVWPRPSQLNPWSLTHNHWSAVLD